MVEGLRGGRYMIKPFERDLNPPHVFLLSLERSEKSFPFLWT